MSERIGNSRTVLGYFAQPVPESSITRRGGDVKYTKYRVMAQLSDGSKVLVDDVERDYDEAMSNVMLLALNLPTVNAMNSPKS